MNANFPWKRLMISMNYFERVFPEFWPQIKKHILYRTYVLQNSHFWTMLLTTGCLLNFSFLKVYTHLTANFIYNDTIFERIFISVFWILVFSMLNLHFSVNYSMSIVYRRIHLSDILSKLDHFLLLKKTFLMIPRQNPRASILSNVF